MSAIDTSKPVEQPTLGSLEPAPAPVLAGDNTVAPVEAAKTEDLPKVEGETAAAATAPVVEEDKKDAVPDKVVEPIHSGALGYKAPGLKNAFRFSKKYFWFGEEPVPASNLREYLRGEKPEVAHSTAAWSSQTGKGLLFFVKHADQKEHPAGILNLAYASDLVKDGTLAFTFKISGHKHAFEAQSAPERDGWFVAVERAITEAKAAKDGIESSEGYKAEKETIGKPVALAGATASASAPKKSIDATPKLAEGEAATDSAVPTAAVPARTGSSSSSSSSDEEKKAKKSKSKSRSASRKRASIFGGLLGKKDKEHKPESEVAKTETEAKKDDTLLVPHVGEVSVTAPVITSDIPKVDEELKTETAPIVAAPVEGVKTAEETPAVATQEKPKPAKRGSIFGLVDKLRSPTSEKKESDLIAPAAPAKDADVATESKPLEEAQVGVPATAPAATEVVAPKADEAKVEETKPAAVHTPSKEKEHFSFGKLFGSKERAKSPAATQKAPEPTSDVAPRIEDSTTAAAPAPLATEPVEPVEPVAPVTETKPTEEKVETPKKDKRASFFGNLSRSLSKATGKKEEKKQTDAPATIHEATEETTSAVPASATATKEEIPSIAAPAEKTIGDVPAEAVTVGEAPKSANPTVATTA
ncbi:hypothetical protein ACN47E_005140 [Coniothyrium glycines]